MELPPLYESQEWFRTTLASIGDAVLVTDSQGRGTFLNPVAAALTGWPEAEALGRDITEVFRGAGQVTGASAIAHDITARKRPETLCPRKKFVQGSSRLVILQAGIALTAWDILLQDHVFDTPSAEVHDRHNAPGAHCEIIVWRTAQDMLSRRWAGCHNSLRRCTWVTRWGA
jgi:hypothetical protein